MFSRVEALFALSSRAYPWGISSAEHFCKLFTGPYKKINQRQTALSISWTRQEPRRWVESSVILDPGVPGSNSTAVNSLFLCHFFFSKWGQQKISKSTTEFFVFQQSFYWTRRFDPETRAFFGYTSKLSKQIHLYFLLLCLGVATHRLKLFWKNAKLFLEISSCLCGFAVKLCWNRV